MSLIPRLFMALLSASLEAALLGSISWIVFGSSSLVPVAGICAGFVMGRIAGWLTFAPPPLQSREC